MTAIDFEPRQPRRRTLQWSPVRVVISKTVDSVTNSSVNHYFFLNLEIVFTYFTQNLLLRQMHIVLPNKLGTVEPISETFSIARINSSCCYVSRI